MSDIVQILYDGVDAFAPQPTPLVGLGEQTIYADEIWGRAETLTLEGQITGCTYDLIVSGANILLSRFNKSFQSLEIWQTENSVSGKVFQKDLVEISSIQFDQSRWFGALPYTINLTCYPSGLFSGAYGVLNPQDNWTFAEQENEVLDITHTISCQPFNTSSGPSNALTNARDWAFGRTGINNWVSPIMISGVSPENFCLLTQTETIDRFNGTYSLTENYTNDLARSGYGVIRYSTDLTSGDNLINVTLNGVAQGCNRNITGIRAAFNNLDKVAIATKQYESAFNRTDLNPIPTAQSFNENPFTTEISFSYSFDNSNLPSVWFDYDVSLNVGTNGFISANINGTVLARGGDTASKLERAKAYASTINLYNLVLPFYNSFDASSITPLNSTPVNNSQSNNETDGTVGLAASFNNRVGAVDGILDEFNATINITPSLAQVDAQPIVGSLSNQQPGYSVVSLGYGSRAIVSINGTAVVNRNVGAAAGESTIRQQAYQLFTRYGRFTNATLDQNVVTTSRTDERVLSFNFVWSCGPTNVVGPTSISSLNI